MYDPTKLLPYCFMVFVLIFFLSLSLKGFPVIVTNKTHSPFIIIHYYIHYASLSKHALINSYLESDGCSVLDEVYCVRATAMSILLTQIMKMMIITMVMI